MLGELVHVSRARQAEDAANRACAHRMHALRLAQPAGGLQAREVGCRVTWVAVDSHVIGAQPVDDDENQIAALALRSGGVRGARLVLARIERRRVPPVYGLA